MNIKTTHIIGLLLLTLAACTAVDEEPLVDEDQLEDSLEPADELGSTSERMNAEIPSVRFETKVDLDAQRETEAARATACGVEGEVAETRVLAPLARGLVEPGFRVEEDPIAASLAAQEARDLEAPVHVEREPDLDHLAKQERYLAAAAELEAELGDDPERLAEAKAELKLVELGG